LMIGTLALGLGAWYFFTDRPEWQTMIFTSLAFMQVFQALASRSEKESLFKIGFWSNPALAGLVLVVVTLQMMVIYIPAFAAFFEVLPLSFADLGIATAAGLVVFTVMEVSEVFKKD
jgi:P-type Ca2+ transporter type 2C